jgi:diazepam-binding inhibitor (GABA receptor modulating acyl-CoA-binding protein)
MMECPVHVERTGRWTCFENNENQSPVAARSTNSVWQFWKILLDNGMTEQMFRVLILHSQEGQHHPQKKKLKTRMTDLESSFNAAAEKARSVQNVSNDNRLKLYGLFKQATLGPVGDRPRPGMFSPTERAKYDAWALLGEKEKEEAMEEYVTLVGSL